MEISFSTHQDIQVVQIKGKLGDSEAAAVRFKLEKKINTGRMKVLFELSEYELTDNTARRLLHGILDYSLNRGAVTVCCGVASSNWPSLLLPGARQVKIFLSFEEGISFLGNPTPAAATAPAVSSAVTKGPVDAKKENENFKTKALEELLGKYSVFQQSDNDDPFRLEFHLEQYRAHPSAETLTIERKAREFLEKTEKDVRALDLLCAALSTEIKKGVLNRKYPVTEQELGLKEKTLVGSLAEVQSSVKDGKAKIEVSRKAADTFKKELEETKKVLEREFTDLQEQVKSLTAETEDIVKKLAEQNTAEEKEFEEKKSRITKA